MLTRVLGRLPAFCGAGFLPPLPAYPVSLGKELPYKIVFQITEASSVRSARFLELFGGDGLLPTLPLQTAFGTLIQHGWLIGGGGGGGGRGEWSWSALWENTLVLSLVSSLLEPQFYSL